jgi:Mg2+ and Co2+ transporter CorA
MYRHQHSSYGEGGGVGDDEENSPLLLEAGLKGLSISETSPLLSNNTTTTATSSGSGSGSDNDNASCVSDRSVRSVPPLPGMQLRAHVLEKGVRRVRTVPVQEAIKRKNKHAQYWIDIDADQDKDREEMNAWFVQQLPFLPAFILSRLAEPSQTWASQVVALDTAILAVIRILPMEDELDSSSSDNPAAEYTDCYMAAVVVHQLLLTFTSGPRQDICGLYDKARSYMNARENPANSTDALFGWLYFHIERTSRALRELRYSVLKMDEAMDRDMNHVPMRQLIDAKDLLLKIFSVAEEQHECLEALQGASSSSATSHATGSAPSHPPSPNGTTAATTKNNNNNNNNNSNNIVFSPGTLAVLVAQSAAAERMAVRLEKQLCDLRQRHESFQHDRMNRRLAMLTAMSAVFLPLTLITGIWGTSLRSTLSNVLVSLFVCSSFCLLDGACRSKHVYWWPLGPYRNSHDCFALLSTHSCRCTI